jgi:excisionase family DNA binding protein
LILPDDIVDTTITLKDQYMDLKGLSAYSHLAVSTLRDYIRAGKLPCFKLAGKILIRRSEFDQWMEAHRMTKKKDIKAIVNDAMRGLQRHWIRVVVWRSRGWKRYQLKDSRLSYLIGCNESADFDGKRGVNFIKGRNAMSEMPKVKAVYDKDTYRMHRYLIAEGQPVKGTLYIPKDTKDIPKRILIELSEGDGSDG